MKEGARARRGGINKIEGGEGVECCVFVVTQKHINFGVDTPRSAASCKPRPSNTAPLDERWEKGRTRGGGVLVKLERGEGHFLAAMEKKVKYHGLVCPEMHEFYMKTNLRQKSGDAVACPSVAPMPLHCPIRHTGRNIQLIIAQQRRKGGGGVLLHYWYLGAARQLLPRHLILGIIFRSAGRHPQK